MMGTGHAGHASPGPRIGPRARASHLDVIRPTAPNISRNGLRPAICEKSHFEAAVTRLSHLASASARPGRRISRQSCDKAPTATHLSYTRSLYKDISEAYKDISEAYKDISEAYKDISACLALYPHPSHESQINPASD
eukprot:751522-Hanusia_phi.AAC.1